MTEIHDTDRCPLTDAVLAQFLDGANDATTLLAREELALHRDQCAVCREALERARRLDALVAATADRHVGEARVELWLEQAIAARSSGSARVAPRRVLPRLVAALLLLGAGVALGLAGQAWFSRPSHELPSAPLVRAPQPEPRVPDRVAVAPIGVETVAAPQAAPVDPEWLRGLPAPIAIAEAWSLRTRRAPRPSSEDHARALRAPLLPLAESVAARWHLVGLSRATRAAAAELAAALVAERAVPELGAALAELPDDFRLSALREAVSRSNDCVQLLRQRVRAGESHALAAAARLGGVSLDAELLAFADGDPERAALITDALRGVGLRPGRGELRLRLLDDVVARGRELVPETDAIARLFAGAGEDDAAQVAAIVERSRSAAQRRRGLLALGVIGSPLATPTLLRTLRSPRLDEARIAAFALGRLPRGGDDAADAELEPRRRALLLAALASRGELAARQAIASLTLTDEEREFLRTGHFTLDQFDIAVRLFRERGGAEGH
ncbi:MAG: hypothetical protein IT457_22700 [Planctomycetes bacterium]|nr:hypothetical protein [Planctomycetota bacterium]